MRKTSSSLWHSATTSNLFFCKQLKSTKIKQLSFEQTSSFSFISEQWPLCSRVLRACSKPGSARHTLKMTGWKQNIHFPGVFFWGSVLLWFRNAVVCEQSWTATAFPVPLWVLALEPPLGDSTQLILLQWLLTNSLCNSWARMLLNAGFLMEQNHTQQNPKLECAVQQGIGTTGRTAGNHSFKPETLVLILHWTIQKKSSSHLS